MSLPEDPAMLYSFVNTKLRDEFSSLDAFCEELSVDKADLLKKLKSHGFEYNPSKNRFW